jgi:hypothetical protein
MGVIWGEERVSLFASATTKWGDKQIVGQECPTHTDTADVHGRFWHR